MRRCCHVQPMAWYVQLCAGSKLQWLDSLSTFCLSLEAVFFPTYSRTRCCMQVKLTDLERKAIRTYVGYNGFRIRVVTAHDPGSLSSHWP